MKDQDAPPTLISIPDTSKAARLLVVRNRYKLWVLSAILLLAFWSMFTGSVTLRWSSGNLTGALSDDLSIPTYDDLDILEVENREKVVRHMWELYIQRQSGSGRRSMIRLPRFWQEAFEAAYDPLSSDVLSVENAVVSEIAKMSIRSINVVDSFPLQTKGITEKDDQGKPRKARAIYN